MDKLDTDYYKNLTEYFSPTTTWTDIYWESVAAPYNFNDEEKTLLNDIYDQLDNVWFKAMSSKIHGNINSRMTHAQAIWICILCKINPKLKTNAVDVWIMSEYFSASYINALLNKTIDLTTNPIASADPSALKYIEKEPFASAKKAEAYHQAINKKFINPVASTWSKLERKYTEGIRSTVDDHVLDYPMLYASQLGSAWYMPRYQSVICIMATMCISIIKHVESIEPKDATDITYRLKLSNFGNDLSNIGKNADYGYNVFLGKSIKKECAEIIKKLSTTNESWINRDLDSWGSGKDLSFPLEAIGLYYSLMKSLIRLLETKGDSTNLSINTDTLDHNLTMTHHSDMPVDALFYELAPKYATDQINLYDLYINPHTENQNEKETDERKLSDDSKPKVYNWINWDDDKEYT
jgi:hypothetical protein